MLNKSLAFGLLAAGLMVAPGAAFANSQRQESVQITTQGGAAINRSVNTQSSEGLNIQNQIRVRQQGGSYRLRSYCPGSYSTQSQTSTQASTQNSAAIDYSDNAQGNSSVSEQKQVVVTSTGCYR
ncbi:MAG: hypothetical protein HC836_14630 [Richelia sp. RM2_1_2]|nr:hypothetical protein [Richelia sp. SM2_1_7]NJM18833.1 hypothetical protein [Richelia sp. SM1_7_0]NJN07718.1 hypothetical protein [Richelia sp. RM1_1_1]NJO27331.1 hypothetical protein [Richelia sp. SL_2_1]NJO59486.1 hypothetical protein [Richelia sp. RM2_1_2]